MSQENFLWGAPRIHGELLKLGFVVSQATVSRYSGPFNAKKVDPLILEEMKSAAQEIGPITDGTAYLIGPNGNGWSPRSTILATQAPTT
jgi:hypothetical protein